MKASRLSDEGLLETIVQTHDQHLLTALAILQREPAEQQHAICQIIRALSDSIPHMGPITAFEMIVAIGEHAERESLR